MVASVTVTSLTLSRGERTLFRDLSLHLRAGEAVALTGANGAGKTSLLRAVSGFLRPDGGEVAFADATGDRIEPETARGRDLHLLGHLDGLKGQRTARDELTFQTRWLGGTDAGVAEAADRLGLAPLLDLEVRRLSAGQRRRLALARLIAAPRPLWLLDEPLSPLDTRWRRAAGELMLAHLDRGGLILAAVHDPLPVAARAFEIGAGR
ncbi:heme ABC exporter ATP-binding protein CcmA [Brevundimonas sp. PAMC22021]|uniref:heme ABC exporter ATP-binding protein CcmA n=1 Tax=Brevundimonas sp. PAMC22021 TaxID=2861285 RepID=UPI001C637D58|nr:heme ABC exporter ATP-binding protein CcmA [Brevundimonas sp. PAMC22021]QYF88393.1 heme ABC exporter ATP-binding protein CcmA [Brevundimonas sp. PAMC22021]